MAVDPVYFERFYGIPTMIFSALDQPLNNRYWTPSPVVSLTENAREWQLEQIYP